MKDKTMKSTDTNATGIATFGAGCFWCTEAVFQQLPGVESVASGFMGGSVTNPTYEQVCEGTTGHAEVTQIKYDPAKISYETLLGWFWAAHDPTQLNRQGADVGTQYRSVIFYHSEEQAKAAIKSKESLTKEKKYKSPIVTEITTAGVFYQADVSHQDYYRRNKNAGYCRFVITPKLEKLGLQK